MDGHMAWQAWRAAVLPAVERILGQSLVSATTRPVVHLPRRQLNIPRFQQIATSRTSFAAKIVSNSSTYTHKEIQERKDELDGSGIDQYPRLVDSNIKPKLKDYIDKYGHLNPGEKTESSDHWVAGRVSSIRKAGSKLAFVDIYEEPGYHKLQLMLNLSEMNSVEKKTFSDHVKLISRGDVISAVGRVARTSAGELSIIPTSLPDILSPCLHRVPLTSYQSQSASETDIELPDRHVEMLTDPSVISTLVTRSKLVTTMRRFFDSLDFVEVQTPILAAAAGGATARPFETVATEFSNRKLWLRIAPELWLKRLILGGLSRVYEIGPSFRNEGLDKTHNPEFTTCEFYAAYHTLPQLRNLTEDLLRTINQEINLSGSSIEPLSWTESLSQPFHVIDFIPALNVALGVPLPNLALPTARDSVLEIFKSNDIPVPDKPTLPRLLDKLCSRYLESQTDKPTWIINTPECLSPLAKSFIHPNCENDQPVAARAELFINQREVVNCYEEENSPFEQRRKFIDQQRYAKYLPPSLAVPDVDTTTSTTKNAKHYDDEAQNIDHDYLRALEWGLPPTGGWGCGIDRLAMLFTGKERISDVLSFGSLRAVTRGAERYSSSGDNEPNQSKE